MKKYEHITEMETILDNHSTRIRELNELLDYLKGSMDDFKRLMAYYYSPQRQEDLRADEEGLMEEGLKRGVLSEDAIYDLISDYYSSCVKMLELSASYLRQD